MNLPDDVAIEPARDRDYEWCAGVMATTDPWITLGRDLDGCRKAVRRPGAELYIARRGEEPLGFILLHPTGAMGQPYVASVAAAEEARGQGVGRRLLDFAEHRYPGARSVFLCVTDFNTGARRLYERVGYEVVGELEDYVVPGHSEILMRKRLG